MFGFILVVGVGRLFLFDYCVILICGLISLVMLLCWLGVLLFISLCVICCLLLLFCCDRLLVLDCEIWLMIRVATL